MKRPYRFSSLSEIRSGWDERKRLIEATLKAKNYTERIEKRGDDLAAVLATLTASQILGDSNNFRFAGFPEKFGSWLYALTHPYKTCKAETSFYGPDIWV